MSRGQSTSPGIYVEILIDAPIDRVWELTQQPALHQRWDLRFTGIQYLPRPDPAEPQRFLYETRLGFGLRISGTGETEGQRSAVAAGDTTSSLRFASDDPKSLIRTGSGYWKYVPTAEGVRFFTWYDYKVRYGAVGRWIDRLCFRPLIGWATAWSFDRLRLWAETGEPPEVTGTLALVHALARTTVAGVWLWHGLVPKLLASDADEAAMLYDALPRASRSPRLLAATRDSIGLAEALFGAALLLRPRSPRLLLASALAMPAALAAVACRSPRYLTAAFNPVTLNLSVAALSLVGLLASRRPLPTASRCRRTSPTLP